MDKNYKGNQKLNEYLETNLKRIPVAEPFKPILLDILQRRAFEYNLSPAEIQQDVRSLVCNLKKIEIRDISKECGWAAGLFDVSKSNVSISKKYFDQLMKGQNYEELYSTITHEVYHALNADENGNDRFFSRNRLTGYQNMTLHEAVVDKSSYRCVINRKKNDDGVPYYYENEGGYKDAFITDIMAASYGISEKHFLKYAIMGRNKLAMQLANISKEDIDDTYDYLDGIEANFTRLHNLFYRSEEDPEIPNKSQELIDTISSIYRLSEWRMQNRMENFKIDSIKTAEFFEQYFKYNHNKMYYSMENACDILGRKAGVDIKDKVNEEADPIRKKTTQKISIISQVLANRDKMPSEEEALRIINLVKSDEFTPEDMEKLKGYGIEISNEEKYALSPEFLKSRVETDFSNAKWDNSCLRGYLENVQVWSREQRRNDRRENIKAFFRNIGKVFGINNNQKVLGASSALPINEIEIPPIEEISENREESFASLTPEQMKEFKRGEQEILQAHNNAERNSKDDPEINKKNNQEIDEQEL